MAGVLWFFLLELVCVENPAYVILWAPIVVVVVVGLHGLLGAGEWQMTCVVAIGCIATVVGVVGVEWVVVFLFVMPL